LGAANFQTEIKMNRFAHDFAMSTAIAIVTSLVVFAASAPGYHVVKTYKLGGEGGWDYLTLDNSAHRLYISRATRVMVIDTESGKQVGEIADTPGVHGIALVPVLNKGFTSNGREGTVSIFDVKTLKTLSKVKVGENPDAILYDSATKRIFTFNGRSRDSSVLDAAQGKVVGTIKLDGKPEFAVSDEQGELFVNIEDMNEVEALDPTKLEVKGRWSMAGCEEPTGLALDREHRRLFSGCDKLMAIVDADSGKEVTSLPICDGVDATAYDPETKLAFASCHDGKLTVIREESPDKFRVVENVTTQQGARTMTLDPKAHEVYTVTAKLGAPPAATAQNPHPPPSIEPNTFVVLVLAK
jgi:DNA-binding beta-propeller fold protein YncE